MSKRRLLLRLTVLTVIVGAGFGAYVYWTSPSRYINETASKRIVAGMNQEEVEAILGPPGDFSSVVFTNVNYRRLRFRKFMTAVENSATQSWISNSGIVIVRFEDDKVVSADFEPLTPDYGATLRKWLRID